MLGRTNKLKRLGEQISKTYHLISKLLRAISVGNRARKNTKVNTATHNITHEVPQTAGSSRQEAWFETVTKGVPFGLPIIALFRMSRFFTWTFWPPPVIINKQTRWNIGGLHACTLKKLSLSMWTVPHTSLHVTIWVSFILKLILKQ